jgi:hypothetical protein
VGKYRVAPTARGGANDGLDFIIEMRVGVIPGDIDGAGRMPFDYGLQQLGHFPAPLAAAEEHYGFTRVVVNGPQTIALVRLPWGENHDLLPSWAPHRA